MSAIDIYHFVAVPVIVFVRLPYLRLRIVSTLTC